MSRRLRVLVVLPAAVVGGAERWLLDLLAATDRLEVHAVVLADGPIVGALRELGLPVEIVPTGTRAMQGLRPAARLRQLLAHPSYDLVLLNGVKAAALGLPVAALLGVPSVWVRHDHSFGRRLARTLARLATAVVVTDPQLAPDVGREATVILPPAPPPALERSRARALLGLGPGELVLAVVGRLVDYKGADDAVLALTHPQAQDWTLLVVGEDDPAAPGEAARLEQLVRQHGLQSRVRFAGQVQDAGRRLSAVDALAVLTKPGAARSPGREGFGLTALEAARAGVPVVAVEGSPPAHRYAPGAGLAVPPADPAAVAGALAQLHDPAVRARLGAGGRALTEDHPDAGHCADALVRVLAGAARRPGAGLEGPAASVIVTVRDEQESVGLLLDRLLPQLRDRDELVVVDGGSRDRTVELLHSAAATEPRLVVLERPGAGISLGRNLAIAAARGEVLACTDAGCEPVPGWLGELVAPFAEQPAPDLVTGVYRARSQRRRWWSGALAAVGYPEPEEARRPSPLVRAYGALLGRTFDPSLPTGRSMAFTPTAWARAGGFPEHLVTGEDVSYGRSIVAQGGRAVLAVGAEVAWEQRTTLASNLRMYRAYGRGDGLTGSPLLIGRNVLRAVAYPAAAVLLAGGSRSGRVLVATGAAAYLSLPAVRTARREPVALPAVPVTTALRDLAKAWGCLDGVRARNR